MDITQDRKHYHNLESELSKEDLCPHCGKGVLVPQIAFASYSDESASYGKCNRCGYTTT
jgi:hypothetical protein